MGDKFPSLLSSAFIDSAYFRYMTEEEIDEGSEDEIRLIYLINAITVMFEKVCGRKLKARDFSYDPLSVNYDFQYSIFDPPPRTIFWFPTYPVNSLTTFIVSDDTITEATDYEDTDGYFLYPENGKLVYSYGFDYGYNQNVKAVWNGGYSSTNSAYNELQYLTYQVVKKLWDSEPGDDEKISETLDNYKYTKASPEQLSKFFGMPPFVFYNLFNYKRLYFA